MSDYDEPALSTSRASREARRNLHDYDYQKAVQGNSTRVSMGNNSHHALYRKIGTDQILYSAGLISAKECHPDCDLGALPNQLSYARNFLSLNGSAIRDDTPSLQVIARALTTSDYPNLLGDTANRAATLGFDSAPEVWPLITRTTHNRDFKQFSRATAPELPSPPEIGENGEIKHAQLGSDSAETGQIASFAEIITITREAIVNDDSSAITTSLFVATRSTSRLIGDKVFAVLTANAALADSIDLFHSNHGNLATAAAPSITALDTMRGLFAAQVGPSGEKLNIRPRFLLAAPTLESALATIRQAQNTPSPREASSGYISTLTDARLTGTAWYALANPSVHDCIQIVLLEGDQTPLRFERRKSNSDGASFLVGVDVEVLAVDYRTAAMNAGA